MWQLSRINAVTPEHFDDPVAAYDRLAAHYADLSRRRQPYLRGVEREIISRIPQGTPSLLDVGAGDGTRTLRIASQARIQRVVLVEPSRKITGRSVEHTEVWPVRAEDLAGQDVGTALPGCPVEQSSTHSVEAQGNRARSPGTAEDGCRHTTGEKFTVITCLWNVLGHIPSDEKRLLAFRAIASFLSPDGRFFLDVNNRYNLRSYGVFATGARWIHDHLLRSESNGDVLARWDTGETSISTYGHVFAHAEVMHLADAAGFELQERVVLDYESGKTRRFSCQGNVLYVFRRSSRIDSASASQTS